VPEPWVVNASPLIILSRISRLDFLESLAPTVLIPQTVIAEVGAGLNRDPTAATTLQWAKGRIVPNLPLPITVAAWGLGAGESQVIAHCSLPGECPHGGSRRSGGPCVRPGAGCLGDRHAGRHSIGPTTGPDRASTPLGHAGPSRWSFSRSGADCQGTGQYRRVISMQSKAIRTPSAGIPAAPDTTPASSAPARATARPARRGSAA